ncbi:MAG TPA: DUF2339 domain-containing protein, partial [Burkholderiales bacterium]
MTWFLVILGGLIGAAIFDSEGLLFGLFCGYLLARALKLDREMAQLRDELRSLRQLVESRAPAAMAAPAAPIPVQTVPLTEAESHSPGSEASTAIAKVAEPIGAAFARQFAGGADAPASAALPSPESTVPEMAVPAEPPSSDDLFARATGAVRLWFTTGNVVVKVGVIVLFFGVAFLVKYVAERTHVPIEVRLAGVALGAVALLVVGWRLREKRRDYALVIQGGAVGVLYLTVFAALKLYQLLPAAAALALLAAVAVFTAALAVLQEARSLALFGVTGGFLAPILASTGGGSHVMLFSYYALINAGILAIAWHRAWRELNLAGWAFTFAIGALWGWQYYQPQHFATTEPFLVLFFLFYVAIAVLFASRQPGDLRGLVDGTLVFGTPLVAFALQSWLTRDMEFGAAISAAAAGGFYILLARWLWGREGNPYRLLVEAFLALGVVFLTLAIPLALDGRWTAATWALEGAGIFWVGLRQNRLPARLFGLGLQVAAGAAYLKESGTGPEVLPALYSAYLGAVMISAAGWISARLMHLAPPEPPREEGNLMWPASAWALAWWY